MNGDYLEKFRYHLTFQDVLKQCQETARTLEGSTEDLKHILQVEATLERQMAEMN